MGQHAGDELLRRPRQPEPARRVVEQVPLAVVVPQAEVDVRPVAGLVRPWLGGKRGHQADRAATPRTVSRTRSGCRPPGPPRSGRHRQLLLPVAQLGVVLLHLDALLAEGRHGRVGDLGRAAIPTVEKHGLSSTGT